jgi:hypothetical protein
MALRPRLLNAGRQGQSGRATQKAERPIKKDKKRLASNYEIATLLNSNIRH